MSGAENLIQPSKTWSVPKDTRFRRRIHYARHLLKRAFLVRKGYQLCTLGEETTGCSWTFSAEGLTRNSVIYSGGVGNDISFEQALVKKFGSTIQLFDPSPTALATMERAENQIPELRFSQIALAGSCGTLRLSPPLDAKEGSWFSSKEHGTLEIPCLDLKTLLEQNRHQQIDLLKLDIEGAEYGVIENIVCQGLPVRQILVEFHDGILPGIRLRQSLRAIFQLLRVGYKLLAEVGNNHTFIR